jgi:hypothetical protein
MLHGKRCFTTIDLKDVYFQIPLRLEDREKTSFSTGNKLMMFKYKPQGYKNSLGVFQRAMIIVLKGILN